MTTRSRSSLIKHTLTGLVGGAALTAGHIAAACELPVSPAPEGASVYIVSPKDGDTVSNPVKVVFGLSGMGVAPAGSDVENTGHHHLLVDQVEAPAPCMPMGNPPLHFGKGQTETELTLEPGKHSLQLVLGNFLHIPHDPMIASEIIEITVE